MVLEEDVRVSQTYETTTRPSHSEVQSDAIQALSPSSSQNARDGMSQNEGATSISPFSVQLY
jgi:hypothetical protein